MNKWKSQPPYQVVICVHLGKILDPPFRDQDATCILNSLEGYKNLTIMQAAPKIYKIWENVNMLFFSEIRCNFMHAMNSFGIFHQKWINFDPHKYFCKKQHNKIFSNFLYYEHFEGGPFQKLFSFLTQRTSMKWRQFAFLILRNAACNDHFLRNPFKNILGNFFGSF